MLTQTWENFKFMLDRFKS